MPKQIIPYNYCGFCGQLITGRNHNRKKFCNSACAMSKMYNSHLPIGERFASQITHGEKCWLWTGRQGGKRGMRYGLFNVTPKTPILAHRFSYAIHYNWIPDELWVLHRCDTSLCVNPAHLPKDEVRELRRRYDANESPAVIAREMSIPYGNLIQIALRNTHKKHLVVSKRK